MTLTEQVEQAWQDDHSRQQAAAEAIQAAMARTPAPGPHDTATSAPGVFRVTWDLAA